jgi:ethanolamine utilization cobalamin adenosyltransferase
MTSLSGNRLVSKAHGRIAFRGAVDSLEAEIIEAQILAEELGETWYRESLAGILSCLRDILASEVKETPLTPPRFFGLSSDEIRRRSHDVKGTFGFEHPLPDYTMGPLAARLNLLRARVREAELLAVRVFGPGEDEREDLILAMNRLSSALYWLFAGVLATAGESLLMPYHSDILVYKESTFMYNIEDRHIGPAHE